MRKADPKHFKNIIVDEANILNWKGLIVPVSQLTECTRRSIYTKGRFTEALSAVYSNVVTYSSALYFIHKLKNNNTP